MANILQSDLMTDFLYPLVLMFVLVFAVLEKIQIFSKDDEDKKQLHAIIALVISLIFVGAVFPKLIISNLVQFLTVGLAIIFVSLVLWGFVSGEGKFPEKMTKVLGWIIGFAVFFAVLWATGASGPLVSGLQKFFALLFGSDWSSGFWINLLFILIIGAVVAIVLKSETGGSGGESGSSGNDK